MAAVNMRALSHRILPALAIFTTGVTALRVTPNSPCSSICLDPGATSDNSTIPDEDILCSNRDYASVKGQQFQGCINCLQNSTYESGSQSDQAWFIYNLRYAFAHCVFGYPDGNGIGPYPCMTSEACGPLKETVSRDLANNTGTDAYGYCNYRGGSKFGETFQKCLDCMGPDTEHGYLTNYFVALEAGCEQRPTPHRHIALNDTLFANTTISISSLDPEGSGKSSALSPTATIIVAVVASVVGVAVIAATAFFCCRRRRAGQRSAIEVAARRHMRGDTSSMEFRSHVSPFTPGRRRSTDGYWYDDPHHAAEVQTATAGVVMRPGLDAGGGLGGFRTMTIGPGGQELHPQQQQGRQMQQPRDEKSSGAVYGVQERGDEKQKYQSEEEGGEEEEEFADRVDALNSHPPAGPVRNFSRNDGSRQQQQQQQQHADGPETAAALASSLPYSPDSYATPSSTTSATPFFANGGGSGGGANSYSSPHAPPPLRQAGSSLPLKQQASWEEMGKRGGGLLSRGGRGGKADVSAPVAAMQMQTSFPPPPKK